MRFPSSVFLFWCLVFSVPRSEAETFYGPSSTTNKSLIASNESVIITSIMSAAGLLTADDMASDSSHPVLELGFRATLPTLPAEGLPSR